ncbi:hypothetical protein DXG03_003614 [Asterophora parasitica]|uniref:Ketoreductase domain-containing protein n=1 Tax=Asterophora parasitica TaxID=117018 RepID=A0A9P7KAN6_9AGAR|nr:hypothetical protein DXG03_003614 [Asterophora parasitica]
MTGSNPGTNQIEALIEKYSSGLDANYGASIPPPTSAPVVLLTGSTGHLGAHLLAALLQDDRVERVYALNQRVEGPQSLHERQLERFKDVGLDPALLESEKLGLLPGDLTQPGLNLDRGRYGLLCGSVNIVIHTAWNLDFNVALNEFEPHIQGTRNLIDLLKSGPNASTARFVFTSSTNAVQGWDKSRGAVTEGILTDASVALGGGYGEAKYISERILAKSDLTTTSVRIGQISGGRPKGAWATTHWLPILVKSSLALGGLPQAEGFVSWVPADTTATALVDVALGSAAPPAALNLLHPKPIDWNTVVEGIRAAIKEVLGRELELVSLSEWITKVEARGAPNVTAETLADIPAIKLLDFFRKASQMATTANEFGGVVASFTTDKTQSASDTVAQLLQIGPDDVRSWVQYWHDVGFLV